MPKNYHPLVKKTKTELERLDKLQNLSWEEKRGYSSEFLPISVEPKLRRRALMFMDSLIKKLEKNGHCIKFEYGRCNIDMYGKLTEIDLRQKYFRKRIKDQSGYSSNVFVKSEKLEFQIGSSYRKGWIDRANKCLEDYLEAIYEYIEKDSFRLAELWKQQRIEREEREVQKKIQEEIIRQKAIEDEKIGRLIKDAEDYKTANSIRLYLKAFETKVLDSDLMNADYELYLKWAYKKADEIDPLSELAQT